MINREFSPAKQTYCPTGFFHTHGILRHSKNNPTMVQNPLISVTGKIPNFNSGTMHHFVECKRDCTCNNSTTAIARLYF